MKREEIKKEKVIDNMDYKTEKDEMQKDNGMLVADVSNKMNTKQINAYIKAYQSGSPVKDLIPPGLTKSELIQLQKLDEKRSYLNANY